MSKKKPQQNPKGQQQRGRQPGAGAGTQKPGPKKKLKPNTKRSGGGGTLQDVPLVGKVDDSDVSDVELSDEDLDFVEQHRRRLGFLETLDGSELDRSIRAKQERQVKEAAEARLKAAAAAEADEGASEGSEEEEEEGRGGRRQGSEEEEEAYERAPRRVKADPRDKSAAGLPIKTLSGDVVYDKAGAAAAAAAAKQEAEMEQALAAAAAIKVEGVTITDDMETALADTKRRAAEEAERRAAAEKKKVAAAAKKAEEALLPPALRGLNLSSLDPPARRARLQEVMAAAAQKLLAAPELGVGELRTLQALVGDEDSMTSRLALLTLFAVFKDILPGYRIRPPSEKELEVKVSKEVAKLREYEQALLKAYQTYLRSLLDAAQCVQRGRGTLSHSRVAVRCLCGLLGAHPHFNYTSDILQAVVPRMASPDPETRALALEAVQSLLRGGEGGADEAGAGRAALEAVQLVADLVRTRKCVAPPEVVRCLAVLRFRDVLRPAEDDEEGQGGKRKHKGKKAEKREAKRRRKEDDVDRAFKEAAAGPDREEMARLQSSMLEALFEIYFRVLKHCCAVGLAAGGGGAGAEIDPTAPGGGGGGGGPRVPSASSSPPWSRARLLKKCPLLHAVLDGLARYTHLISVDYLNDLMALFNSLLAAPALPLPERLRLLATIAALLRGQGEALNVDRRDLYVYLYDTLLQVPLHPLISDDPATAPAANHQHPQHPNGAAAGTADADGDADGDADDEEDIAMAVAYEQAAASAAAAAELPPGADAASSASTSTPDTPSSVAVLLAGVVEALLCEPRMADMQRAAAFVKRLAGVALLAGPGEAMALWSAVGRLLRRYPKLANLLEYEGEAPTVGGRTYDPFCTDPSEAGALSTTLWELCLAHGGDPHAPSHYQPHLAQAAGSLLALRPAAVAAVAASGAGGGAVHLTGPLGTPATISELADAYDASRGLLRPPPPPPTAAGGGRGKKGQGRARRGGGAAAAAAELSPEFLEEVAQLAAEYGSTAGGDGGGGWDGMELDTDEDDDVDSDVVDEDREGEEEEQRRRQPAGTSGSSGGGSPAVAGALRRMFLESRRFHQNKHLRTEKALAVERLKRFHIHLQQKQVQQAAAAAAAAAAAEAKARVGQKQTGKKGNAAAAAANGGAIVPAGDAGLKVGGAAEGTGKGKQQGQGQQGKQQLQQKKPSSNTGGREPEANGAAGGAAAGKKRR